MGSTNTEGRRRFSHLIVERRGAVALLTVHRPEVLNALNSATIAEIDDAFRDLREDDGIRAVVVTGAGEKAFVAGADINELSTLSPEAGREYTARGQAVFDAIEHLGKPVIAAINGYALGGGCELAMACTLRVAADHARLGLPEIKLGLHPAYGGTQRLPRLVGRGKAVEMMLTGDPITADEAQRIGLVNRVVPQSALMSGSIELAERLAASAPVAMRYIMELVVRGPEVSFGDACALESAAFGLVASTDDMREGTAAFLAKRTPRFAGR
jgi:enoyl-CoA hydratase